MATTAELGGIHPRSEQLIDLTRSYDRGKTDKTTLDKQFDQDTRDLVRLEEETGFDSFTDGAFAWQDQLRPLVDSLDGVTTGTRYSRWFDTNTFFKKPTINSRIRATQFEPKRFVRTDLLPKKKGWAVTLIGPYTFSELAENLHYQKQSELLNDVAAAQVEIAQWLKTAGISKIRLVEPCLVYRPYRETQLTDQELDLALAAIRRVVEGVDTSFLVQTYFGDSSKILPQLLKLPVDGVGLDLFETDYSELKIETEKKVTLGIIDARESNVEDPKWVAETATRASKHISSTGLVLAPNSDLKFVPRKVADAKARSLADAATLLEERK